MGDREFLLAFEAQDLSKDDWTHRAHVRVAYLLLRRWGTCAAMSRMRRGILLLNRAHGVLNGPRSGYHETITVTWVALVRHFIAETGPVGSFDEFIRRNPWLLSTDALTRHYSRELLGSPEARAEYVEPDRASLPIDITRVFRVLQAVGANQMQLAG